MYLLDTNVIVELYRKQPHPSVIQWMNQTVQMNVPAYLSVLTLGEIQSGIRQLAPKDSDQAHLLAFKLQRIMESYADRILPIHAAVTLEWGNFLAIDKTVPIDALLAAQAKVYGLTLVTRNVKHIQAFNISFFNPFTEK